MSLELKVPPVIVMLICMILMFLISKVFSNINVDFVFKIFLVIETFFMGLAVSLAGVYSFSLEKTTANPLKPNESSTLVTSGIYKFTRNPMYLGMAVILFSFGIFLGNILTIIGIVTFIFYINKFQIIPEERILEKLFSNDFIEYKRKVRKWL